MALGGCSTRSWREKAPTPNEQYQVQACLVFGQDMGKHLIWFNAFSAFQARIWPSSSRQYTFVRPFSFPFWILFFQHSTNKFKSFLSFSFALLSFKLSLWYLVPMFIFKSSVQKVPGQLSSAIGCACPDSRVQFHLFKH